MEILEVLKLISDKNRIRVLNLLYHKEKLCVCVLEEILEINQSNLSRHLNKLKKAGMIIGEKRSQWVDYSISKEFLAKNRYIEDILRDRMKEKLYVEDLEKARGSKC